VAFLKFSRDKRGYEHFYLVQPSARGKSPPRVLYWFRTPPNVKIGRSPFEPEVQRALEAQNPDVSFDWERIVRTPIPPPQEAERWRERRRAERASRAASDEDEDSIGAAEETSRRGPLPFAASEEPQLEQTVEVGNSVAAAEPPPASNTTAPAAELPPGQAVERRHRRRRRRRGRRRSDAAGPPVAGEVAPEAAADSVQDSEEPDGEPGDGDAES
jgi:hypothetical protein